MRHDAPRRVAVAFHRPPLTATFERVRTHGGAPQAEPAQQWLSADDIAALTGGRATANTVRSWWRKGQLGFTVLPELGTKSNKRSTRADTETFLQRKYGIIQTPTPAAPSAPTTAAERSAPAPEVQVGNADLLDTVASMKAAADAALEGLVAEAEAHAAMTRAMAESDAKRVETLKHLQTMLRGYDLALSTYLQPRDLEEAMKTTSR